MKPLSSLVIGGHTFKSRLFVGTGKFASPEVMAKAVEASGTELVTVAVRRVDVSAPRDRTGSIAAGCCAAAPGSCGFARDQWGLASLDTPCRYG